MWKIEITVDERGQTQFAYPQDRPVAVLSVLEAVADAIKSREAQREIQAAKTKVQEATPTDLGKFLNVNTRGG